MNAHTAAAPARHRTARPRAAARQRIAFRRPPLFLVVSVYLGLFYGSYVGFLRHNAGASASGGVYLGIVSAAVFMVLCYAVGRTRRQVIPEVGGVMYGVLVGCAFGFLYSLGGPSVNRSSLYGLLIGAAVGFSAYFMIHTHRGVVR